MEVVSDAHPKSRFRTDNDDEWPYDPEQLMRDLVEGRRSLLDEDLQMTFLDWMESEEYNEFVNQETGERIHALCSKRSNVVSCSRKNEQRNAVSNAIESMKFDWPVPGTRNDRMTRLIFVTNTFDHEGMSREESWGSLRSSPIPDCNARTGEINNFEANLRKIFGKICKIISKESTSDGWPAPHSIYLLENPVRVREYRGKDGSITERIVDRRILRRIGKDPS